MVCNSPLPTKILELYHIYIYRERVTLVVNETVYDTHPLLPMHNTLCKAIQNSFPDISLVSISAPITALAGVSLIFAGYYVNYPHANGQQSAAERIPATNERQSSGNQGPR